MRVRVRLRQLAIGCHPYAQLPSPERGCPSSSSRSVRSLSEEELRGLGGRLTAMHVAKLLTDEQLWTLEDIAADCAVVLASATMDDSAVGKVLQMLRLSASIEADGSGMGHCRGSCVGGSLLERSRTY